MNNDVHVWTVTVFSSIITIAVDPCAATAERYYSNAHVKLSPSLASSSVTVPRKHGGLNVDWRRFLDIDDGNS